MAVEPCIQFGAQQEGAGQLAVQRVAFLGGRGETVVKQNWDQLLDPSHCLLPAKVEISVVFERLPQNE